MLKKKNIYIHIYVCMYFYIKVWLTLSVSWLFASVARQRPGNNARHSGDIVAKAFYNSHEFPLPLAPIQNLHSLSLSRSFTKSALPHSYTKSTLCPFHCSLIVICLRRSSCSILSKCVACVLVCLLCVCVCVFASAFYDLLL